MAADTVDVAIVGAGLAGLSTAAALHRVRPDARIKVYERRKAPDSLQPTRGQDSADAKDRSNSNAASEASGEEACPQGGGVRLEMNGLKAAAAISRELAADVVAKGLYANKVLLHDTLGGAVMSRLHEPPHPSSPSPRQPALMLGWSELESLLLAQLPPGTVEWETVVTAYTDSHKGVTLSLLRPSASGEAGNEEPVPSHALSTAVTHALDTELMLHMQQQRDQLQAEAAGPSSSPAGAPGEGVPPASPFSAAGAAAGPFSATGPAPASGPAAAAGLLTAPRLERLSVQAKLLVAADGPMSLIRQQCIGDGQPNFEGMVRWVGRLPGDMLSTIPVEQEAWWMGGGMTFASHPLSNGDVAWEAQVSSDCLAKAGLRWDQQTQTILKDTTTGSHTLQAGSSTTAAAGPSDDTDDAILAAAAANAAAAAAAAPAGSSEGVEGFGAGSSSSNGSSGSARGKQNGRAAVPADAPAGEDLSAAVGSVAALAAAAALAQAAASAPTTPRSAAGVSAPGSSQATPRAGANGPIPDPSSPGVRHVKISPAQPSTVVYDAAATDAAPGSGGSSSIQPLHDTKALLLQLFAAFPTACLDMIATTDAQVILEGPVLTRAARQMPACMGRGSVVVLGEAAHPVRPSGQEASQAFEDAAELGAAVMHWGISREALRRFELRRRPRWTHAMQVSQAFGSVTNLGGVALHQGLLDYTAQLYHARFTPLRTMVHPAPPQKRRNPLLHWTGVALVTYGTLAAAGLAHRRLAREGRSPLGQVVVGAVDAVGQSAERLVSSAAGAVQAPGQTAAALKGAATKGLSVAVEGSGQAAAVIGKQVGKVGGKVGQVAQSIANGDSDLTSSEAVVHGEVPHGHRKGVFARMREGVVKRTLGVGMFLSRPFTAVLGHQVRGTVAESLGAF